MLFHSFKLRGFKNAFLEVRSQEILGAKKGHVNSLSSCSLPGAQRGSLQEHLGPSEAGSVTLVSVLGPGNTVSVWRRQFFDKAS